MSDAGTVSAISDEQRASSVATTKSCHRGIALDRPRKMSLGTWHTSAMATTKSPTNGDSPHKHRELKSLRTSMSDHLSDPEAYVAARLTPTVTAAVVALCRERPADPVSWLAEYLIAHKPAPPVSQTVANPAALLQQLLAASKTPCALPVRTHSQRIQSGLRGIGFPLLEALQSFSLNAALSTRRWSKCAASPALACKR